jgi:hypothetical protein
LAVLAQSAFHSIERLEAGNQRLHAEREELKEALEQMAFADLKMHDALDLKDMARRALSRLRGDA